MCVSKEEVRPGIDGIIDHIDVINDVKSKVSPILVLLTMSQATCDDHHVLNNNEITNLLGLVEDMLTHVWSASDGIYAIYLKEVAHGE